jgi:hypothetical protein
MTVYGSRIICQRLANDSERLTGIQDDSGGILGDDTISHCGEKTSYEHVSDSEYLRR